MNDCLFCKIANKKTETKLLYEDDLVAAFPDIHPQASVHILIVPKKHISTAEDLTDQDKDIVMAIFKAAKQIAKEKNLDAYKLLINVGKNLQLVEHLHIHLLSKDYSSKI